ncbi:VWFA and cache domain-containing protein 1, partial [Lates japonicus]
CRGFSTRLCTPRRHQTERQKCSRFDGNFNTNVSKTICCDRLSPTVNSRAFNPGRDLNSVLADNLKSNPGLSGISARRREFTVFPAHKFHCKGSYSTAADPILSVAETGSLPCSLTSAIRACCSSHQRDQERKMSNLSSPTLRLDGATQHARASRRPSAAPKHHQPQQAEYHDRHGDHLSVAWYHASGVARAGEESDASVVREENRHFNNSVMRSSPHASS